jgi:hypothetical protein
VETSETVEASRVGTITVDLRLDWDRIGFLFVTFGIACTGIATVLHGIGLLIQALSHHA